MNQKELIRKLKQDKTFYQATAFFLIFLIAFLIFVNPQHPQQNNPTQPGTYITDDGNYLFSFNMSNAIELQLAEIILQACVVNDMGCSNIQELQWRTN